MIRPVLKAKTRNSACSLSQSNIIITVIYLLIYFLLTHNRIKLIVVQSKPKIQKTKIATKHFDYYLLHHHNDVNMEKIDDIKLEHLKDVNLMDNVFPYLAQHATCGRTTDGAILALKSTQSYLCVIKMFLTEKLPECVNYPCFDKAVYKSFIMNIYKIKMREV